MARKKPTKNVAKKNKSKSRSRSKSVKPVKLKSLSSKVVSKKKATPAIKNPVINLLAPAPAGFQKEFFANLHATDLAMFSNNDRARIAASIWALAKNRKRGTANIRIFNPSLNIDGWTVDHTVLEIVNDDMPFLVASITASLQLRGLTIHHILHPIFKIQRAKDGSLLALENKKVDLNSEDIRAESFIHIQFDHCIDPDLLVKIEDEIRVVLKDVRLAVKDWAEMRKRMAETITEAQISPKQSSGHETTEEAQTFLRWLDDDNFTFLGYRDIDLEQKDGRLVSVKVIAESGLGILRDHDIRVFGGMRAINNQQAQNLQLYVRRHDLLVVTKTNIHSRVHRPVPMDAIFVRRFGEDGEIRGERLFIGLFTSKSYSHKPETIPFLRRKIDFVLGKAGFSPASHDGRALTHILHNYPHDELFQISEDELLTNSLGILQLQERARVAIFVRHDPFERFVTCLIYVPRDRYDSSLRHRFRNYLENAFQGVAEDWNVRIDDSLLARVFVTVRITPQSPDPQHDILEANLREICRSWNDRLRDILSQSHGEAAALTLMRRYGSAFSPSYRDNILPQEAVSDIAALERSEELKKNKLIDTLYQPEAAGILNFKLFCADRPITLSEALPLIENMGLKVEYMGGPYEVRPRSSAQTVFIHEFVGEPALKPIVAFEDFKPVFEDTFQKVWSGECENDGFNTLSLLIGLSCREITILRSFARYLRQLRIPYSHEMMVNALIKHPQLAQKLTSLFLTRHDPFLQGDRGAQSRHLENVIQEGLAQIEVLEEDRIIRRYLNLIQASLRTNYFQKNADGSPKSALAIKFDSRIVDFMPLPKPLFEIFIYSPRTEAIHLRGGKVARGGIRWSDRRDDFRNEILSLMKAQMVKNSVIVPVGSKGGFIVKRPPADAESFQAEGIACYRIMMSALLDITDNRSGNKIIPPHDIVRHDGDDPYLVVAADKGTAKFSDIANSISQEYKFWLDDAFASGGSAGYDHKKMGITARGAWEAIKRHFREIGKDIQSVDFTCIGVGDMSGDVFGNGMLLSTHTKLLAAFDHRHILIDPNPDPLVSFEERKRLFSLPRSSWNDYDRKALSKGGDVYARSLKSIKINTETKKLFGITADSLSPSDLIQILLKHDVELLYFGGIGTYIKASDETHENVGDRANEALRVDGLELRAKVVGEGANLAMTQKGRIEYALKGGRLNTDAIDNSAGVDTSDHEVNIKILLRKIVDHGRLSLKDRNKLLSSMTDDVGYLVLTDNYNQSMALSVAEASSIELLPLHARCIHLLEKSGLLNPTVEFLPDSHEIAERQRTGKGLTRPELAVLLAYAKLWLFDQLLNSDLPDDPYLENDLQRYFPDALTKIYGKDIDQHQLRREIIATVITNSIVNRTGSHFVLSMVDRTGQSPATIARTFLIVRESFALRDVWRAIEGLDNKISAVTQTYMMKGLKQSVLRAGFWLLTEGETSSGLIETIQGYKGSVDRLFDWINKSGPEIRNRYQKAEQELVSEGVPEMLARRISLLSAMPTALDLTQLARKTGSNLESVASIFFGLGHRLGLDWLGEQTRAIVAQTPFQREALAGILDDISGHQRRLTSGIANQSSHKKAATSGQPLEHWLKKNASALERYEAALNEWQSANVVDIAMLTLASRQLAALTI